MAASSSSNIPAAKPPALSYAERARRAGASATSQAFPRPRATGPNGRTRSGDESTSPASSSRNLTPNSSAALTLPGSPPPSSSQTSIEEQQTVPPMSKSPSKAPPPNVWMARREQMARSVVQHGHASVPVPAENPSQPTSAVTNRKPVNGASVSLQQDDLASVEDDPFVVRVPPRGHGHGRANVSAASRTPPSLDDAENWPEMGKGGPSASTSVSSSVVDLDKKDGPLKKGEKPKWVQIPPAELQATHDALTAQSAANSRAQSQHRRNNQAKSRSRQPSQARPSHSHSQSQNRSQNQNQTYGASLSNGSVGGPRLGETSTAQSRTESTTHSRTTSVHSSPRLPTRGRRLPEEQPFVVNAAANANAGPSTTSKKLPNGIPEEHALTSQPSEKQNLSTAHPIYHDHNLAFVAPPPLSAPHSQSHTPYSSHSPVYYPPLSSSGTQGYGYGSIPPSGGYAVPLPVPSPGNGGAPMQQQAFVGYPSYGIQQLPPGQPPFPYMYQPVPFPYYSAHAPDQSHESQLQQERAQHGETGATHLSPVLPPASTMTRPPPPEESVPLSGYRTIAPVPVGPFLDASAQRQSISQVVEAGGEMVFGSVGQPGGMKSPSPVAVVSSTGDEQGNKKMPTAFAVGFEGPATIRVKRSGSGKGGVDELADAIKVIDLTDKGSRWEFGTSTHPDTEGLSSESGEHVYDAYEQHRAVQQQADPQILQPQPHHMLHYPPPNVPPTFQHGGYNMAPQMHLQVQSLPMPSQSPQGAVQPLPAHIPSLAPLPLNPGFVSPLTLSSPGPGPVSGGPVPIPLSGMGMSGGDEWEVRDFGYGFGPTSGSGYIPERLREDRYEREVYRDPRDNFREPREFGGPGGGGFVPGRMRRSSTAGGYGTGYFEGGRGGFGGRRGRGQNGFGRGFSRGGFGGRGGHGNFQRHQPSLSVSTGSFQHQPSMQQQQMSPDVPNPNGYFASPTTANSQYIASPYGQYNPSFPPPQSQPQPQPQPPSQQQSQPLQQAQLPPVPIPVTTLSFPLDPTRLYLLGQLEYYFSLQNLASDFYLRKQMDSRGWIPIHLIASFNRVRQLTQEPQLVKEVLGISSLVEIRDEHVRLSNQQWMNFVLPGAAASTVEGEEIGAVQRASTEEGEKEAEEAEEDDVVFILGGEESRPWTGAN